MLDELNEYSALLIEPYYYKPLRPYLPKDAVTHAAFTTKYCTKYYMALLMELSSIGGAAGLDALLVELDTDLLLAGLSTAQ